MTAWTRDDVDGIAFLYLDIPDKSQNVLGADVMAELERVLDDMAASSAPALPGGLVITSAKPGSFIAGADVAQIDRIDSPDDARYKAAEGQRIFGKIERLGIPTVAAINGYCLGGGCELALACTYRVAAQSSKVRIGLPETKLGILPGWGGTQRLPRIIGIANALDLILTGRLLDPKRALKMGLIDRVVAPGLLIEASVDILKSRPAPARPRLKGFMKYLEMPLLRWLIFRGARKTSAKKTKGKYPAIPAVIDLMEETIADFGGSGMVRQEALAREAEAFGKLVVTDVSRNMRHLFFLDDAQKKYAPYQEKPRTVRQAAVLGAGIMGGGIAWAFSKTGVPVRIKDIEDQALLRALAAAAKVYKGALTRRRLSKAEFRNGMNRISVGLDYTGFTRADIVVEAVVEKMEVKKAVLAEVESAVSADTVIATNTSGLSINEMASVLRRPERFGGLHFFNPVDRMPLVEIIRGDATSESAVATLFGIARKMGKTPILVKDSPGFLVNRILIPYMLEAARMLDEGVSVRQIDRAAEEFGMPMGPLRLVDEIGMDIGLHVARHLESAFGERMAVPRVFDGFIEQGLLGKKTGSGFYNHGRGSKKGDLTVNPRVREIVPASPAKITDTTVSDRLIIIMLLEAIRCLEDRVIQRPEDIDIGMIYGTGFPPFRGGLIRWGTMLGYTSIVKRVSSFRELYGNRFEPPSMLKDILG